MAYSTQAELEARFGEKLVEILSQEPVVEDSGLAIDEAITEAIVDADAEIDLYCGQKYTVPFSTVPTWVNKTSQLIAFVKLHQRHRRSISEEIKDEFERLLGILEQISKGEMRIPNLSESSADVESSTNDGRLAQFRMSHYDQDGNRIEDDEYPTNMDTW